MNWVKRRGPGVRSLGRAGPARVVAGPEVSSGSRPGTASEATIDRAASLAGVDLAALRRIDPVVAAALLAFEFVEAERRSDLAPVDPVPAADAASPFPVDR
jgi:hypothetical protein